MGVIVEPEEVAIDLCLMKASDANRQKLVGMFIRCQSLKALEIHCDYINGYMQNVKLVIFCFLISHH